MYAKLNKLLFLFTVCCLGACGQYGPLYLPEEVPEKAPVQASKDTQKAESAALTKPSETAEPTE